jgi:hypothetical protein
MMDCETPFSSVKLDDLEFLMESPAESILPELSIKVRERRAPKQGTTELQCCVIRKRRDESFNDCPH